MKNRGMWKKSLTNFNSRATVSSSEMFLVINCQQQWQNSQQLTLIIPNPISVMAAVFMAAAAVTAAVVEACPSELTIQLVECS